MNSTFSPRAGLKLKGVQLLEYCRARRFRRYDSCTRVDRELAVWKRRYCNSEPILVSSTLLANTRNSVKLTDSVFQLLDKQYTIHAFTYRTLENGSLEKLIVYKQTEKFISKFHSFSLSNHDILSATLGNQVLACLAFSASNNHVAIAFLGSLHNELAPFLLQKLVDAFSDYSIQAEIQKITGFESLFYQIGFSGTHQLVLEPRNNENPQFSMGCVSPPTTPTSPESPAQKLLKMRAIVYQSKRRPFEMSLDERNFKKRIRYMQDVKASRVQSINLRRGYWMCGIGNTRMNLGNELHIAENSDHRLDRDKNQLVSPTTLDNNECQFFTFNGPSSVKTIEMQRLFEEANEMMLETFKEHGIHADLTFVIEKGFLSEILVYRGQVVGAVLFVFTQKYLWIEDLVIDPRFQRKGLGTRLIQRMQEIATIRQKDILLYAIQSALCFYESNGFVTTQRYLNKYKVFQGQYMEWISPLQKLYQNAVN